VADDRMLFRAGALCAGASAVTTFLLWLLPRLYEPANGFDESLHLYADPLYMTRWWVNFVHVFLALTGYWAAATALWYRNRFLASSSLLWFLLWGFTEIVGVSINIWAVNRTWRAQYATADPTTQEILKANLTGFAAIWDAIFFVILISFLLGTLFLGLAAIGGAGLDRWLGILLLLAVPLTVAILLSDYASITALGPLVAWSYPVLQPVSRALMAVWLWRTAATTLSPCCGLSLSR
jgi:hypothetical protein